jgi:membrane protein
MSENQDRGLDATDDRNEIPSSGLDRMRDAVAATSVRAKDASEGHISIAVPFRAAERNRRVAASVLAGGFAYRLFLWSLPFGLIVGGALGLSDAKSTEDAVATGGLPAVVVDAIGDIARAADSSAWWLFGIGVPLLLWEGYTGAKALQLIHALVWNEPPPRTEPLRSSVFFSGTSCAFIAAIALTWWLREETSQVKLLVAASMIVPLAALWVWVSLRLPHGEASWKALLPGALLVAIGFQVMHGLVANFLAPKLEKSMSLYGAFGVVATLLFVMYFVGRLIVTAPILNSSLHEELRGRGGNSDDESLTFDASRGEQHREP